MWFAKFIFFRVLGWKLSGSFNPQLRKAVVIVVPHTSWHDFFVGLLVRKISGVEINYVGKKELFKPPFGWYFRWVGGAPLDRTSGQNKVTAIAQIFKEKETFRLAMAPEGTRKKVDRWKTGFYYIALQAGVPIIPVSFDYKTKTVTIGNPFYPSGEIDKDLVKLRGFYQGVMGKIEKYT